MPPPRRYHANASLVMEYGGSVSVSARSTDKATRSHRSVSCIASPSSFLQLFDIAVGPYGDWSGGHGS